MAALGQDVQGDDYIGPQGFMDLKGPPGPAQRTEYSSDKEVANKLWEVSEKQKSGLIINTSSIGGKICSPLGSWYHATKHALEGWSDCLRFELNSLLGELL